MEFVSKEAKIACVSVTSFQTIKSEQSSTEFDKYGEKLNNNFPHLQTMETFWCNHQHQKSENRVYYVTVNI